MTLQGLVAVVSGASRGIGRSIALELASRGAAIAVNFRTRQQDAEQVVKEITAQGGTACAIAGDVSIPAEADHLIATTIGTLGRLDVVVNNAGITKDGLIYGLDAADVFEVMRVNFGGVFNCTRAAMPHLMAQRSGSIVNISSVMGERSWVGDSAYAASKAAVNSFTRSSALELARFGVRVNAALPGFTPTDLVAGLLAKDGGQSVKRQIPWRDFATPEQVARVVAFLAGPDSGYMTGNLVQVDGGASGVLGLGHP